jgi:putative tryptophan/tyrosine transport system substrate-binding protein
MRRRQFIALLGGAATWPLPLRAQQAEPIRRIGVLIAIGEDDPEARARVAAFEQGLRELGWASGRNVRIAYRYAGGSADRARSHAAELAAMQPDVILANASPVLAAVLRETRTIPVVFAQVADPVGGGFVDSLARPGGNVTGFTTFEYSIGAKWLELLKEIAPSITRVAVLRDPTFAAAAAQLGRSRRWRRPSARRSFRWACRMPPRSSAPWMNLPASRTAG